MARSNDPLDTYSLRVLVTLLTERNLTRVATRMNQTQPAISAVLRRLRTTFQDELLVRSGNTMVPTPRGLEVLESARNALSAMDRLFTVGEEFVPHTSQQQFKIGCPDYLSTVFLAGVAQELRRQAPNARLLVHPLGPGFNFEQALADGELDVVIGNWPEPPEQLHMGPLLEDGIVCLVAQGHPLAGGMTRDQYLQAPHVVPLHYSATHRGVIDKHLAGLRVTRTSVMPGSARRTVARLTGAALRTPGPARSETLVTFLVRAATSADWRSDRLTSPTDWPSEIACAWSGVTSTVTALATCGLSASWSLIWSTPSTRLFSASTWVIVVSASPLPTVRVSRMST